MSTVSNDTQYGNSKTNHKNLCKFFAFGQSTDNTWIKKQNQFYEFLRSALLLLFCSNFFFVVGWFKEKTEYGKIVSAL